MVIFIDLGNAKNYVKNALQNPKSFASTADLCAFGTLVYFPNRLKLIIRSQAFIYISVVACATSLASGSSDPMLVTSNINGRNFRTMCGICSKSMKILEYSRCRRFDALSLTLNRFHSLFWCFRC